MKTLKLNLATIALACLLVSPCFAGGGSDGGANSVNYKLVEEYNKDVSDLKGYELFREKIELLKKELPGFAGFLEEQAEKMHWYVLPHNITTLPEEKTGLSFLTEQMAFQTKTEIFIDEAGYYRLSPMGSAQLITHESAMSAMDSKYSPEVRAIVNRIFAKKFDVQALQTAIGNARLGHYHSAQELAATKKQMEQRYLSDLRKIANKGLVACERDKYLDEIQRELGNLMFLRHGKDTSHGVRSPFINKFKELEPGNLLRVMEKSPFTSEVSYLEYLGEVCRGPACETIRFWSKGYFSDLALEFRAMDELSNPYERRTADKVIVEFANFSREAFPKIVKELFVEPGMIDVVAINSGAASSAYEHQKSKEWLEMSPNLLRDTRRIAEKVNARRVEVEQLSLKEKRSLLCNGLAAVDKVLAKRLGRAPNREQETDESGEGANVGGGANAN